MVQVDNVMAAIEPQGRKWETQLLRFGNRGINLSVPPEIVPPDQFAVATDVIANRDGTVQSAAGSSALFTAANTHSIRRFENHTDGTTFYVLGIDTEIQYGAIPGGPSAIIDTGFSGAPLTLVAYRIAVLSTPYMYVGDANKNIKIDSAGTASMIGIIRPLPSLGQIALVPVASGAGNLTGDYDWRYTFARLVGTVVVAESTPSDIGTTVTLAAEQADLTLVASALSQGDITNIRLWRRGGTLPDEWRLVATLTDTNQVYTDNTADIDLASAEVMSFDNDLIGTSVDAAGTTLSDLTAVPLPYLWGPLQETLFGCGDPNRPDMVYFSKKGYPESWPAEATVALDSPQDEAVCGLIYDSKSYVFTQEALYELIPNILNGLTWTPFKTPCGHGVVSPYAMCVGPKVWFVAKDGIYEWSGFGESRPISDALRPLFPYQGQEGYAVTYGSTTYQPVDFGTGIQPNLQMRLTYHNGEVWFHYRDVVGNAQTLVYNDLLQSWRLVAVNTYVLTYSDEPPQEVLLGVDLAGNTSQFTGGDRDGTPISSVLMTGGHDQGFPRADKQYGDGALWADCAGGSITVVVYANSNFAATVFSQVLTGSGLQRYVLNLGGIYARHIAYQLTWDATDAIQPVLYWLENSYLPLPEEITQRMTDWDDLGHAADKNVKGLLLTADTRGNAIEIQVLYDDSNVGATFTIGPDSTGKPRTYNIGFAAFRARQVRLLPISSTEWKFYGINRWLFDAEPESLDCHDVYWGDGGYAHDKLIKGCTIEADCEGVERTLLVYDDQAVLQQSMVIGPGIAGIPAIYELSWASFRARNVRIMECSEDPSGPCIGGVPTITTLDPASVAIGGAEFTLTITGTNFREDSSVSFNGTALATTYVSATELEATVPAALIVTAGSFAVIVNNPAPGCGPSGASFFTVSDEEAFAVSAEGVTVCIDSETDIPVYVTPIGGTVGVVTMSADDLPADVTAVFVPPTVTLDADPFETTTMTLTVGASAVAGAYPIIVRGTHASGVVDFVIQIVIETCDGNLRVVSDEYDWLFPQDQYMFKVQDAGSVDCLRLQSESPVEGCDFLDAPYSAGGFRFSPNGQKLAVWTTLTYNGAPNTTKQLVRVYDLGFVMTAGAAWPDVDGTPQPDVYELDAPLLHQVLSDEDVVYSDVTINNDGDIYVLEMAVTPDAVQEEMQWTKSSSYDGGSIITVLADPRMASATGTASFAVTRCGATFDMTANPVEAWWSGSPNPASSGAGVAPPPSLIDPPFCPDAFYGDQAFCPQDRYTATMTLTVDITGLANGVYTDANADHPGTDIFEYSPAISFLGGCGEITAVNRSGNGVSSGLVEDGDPKAIVLTVALPVQTELTLRVKTVAGTLTTQTTHTFDAASFNNASDISQDQCYRIVDPVNNLITVQLHHDSGGVANNQVALIDLAGSDEPVFTISNVTTDVIANYGQPFGGSGGFLVRPCFGILYPGATQFAYAIVKQGENVPEAWTFTNTVSDLCPEQTAAAGGTPQFFAPICLFTGPRTVYILAKSVYDIRVRLLAPAVAADEMTAEAVPGAFVFTPAATVPSAPRGLAPYDLLISGTYRPTIQDAALVINT